MFGSLFFVRPRLEGHTQRLQIDYTAFNKFQYFQHYNQKMCRIVHSMSLLLIVNISFNCSQKKRTERQHRTL